MLTICYITTRTNPRLNWFIDSLRNQNGGNFDGLNIIVVDLWAKHRTMTDPTWGFVNRYFKHTLPMPSVWQGEHKLTKEDWFDASAARNAGLCLAPDGYIAYVDDLSVLAPGWLMNVKQSMAFNGVTLGAYKKIRNLQVTDGVIQPYEKEQISGTDSRWNFGSDKGSVVSNGDMLFGCSLVGPVEAFLQVGGWPQAICAGLGFEDVIMGQTMENAGIRFAYNRNMLTLESEEGHHEEPSLKRSSFEKHPNDVTDKGHAVLNMAKGGMTEFPSHYEGGIRSVREACLRGEPFPILKHPEHDWHTGIPLSEL